MLSAAGRGGLVFIQLWFFPGFQKSTQSRAMAEHRKTASGSPATRQGASRCTRRRPRRERSPPTASGLRPLAGCQKGGA